MAVWPYPVYAVYHINFLTKTLLFLTFLAYFFLSDLCFRLLTMRTCSVEPWFLLHVQDRTCCKHGLFDKELRDNCVHWLPRALTFGKRQAVVGLVNAQVINARAMKPRLSCPLACKRLFGRVCACLYSSLNHILFLDITSACLVCFKKRFFEVHKHFVTMKKTPKQLLQHCFSQQGHLASATLGRVLLLTNRSRSHSGTRKLWMRPCQRRICFQTGSTSSTAPLCLNGSRPIEASTSRLSALSSKLDSHRPVSSSREGQTVEPSPNPTLVGRGL